MNNRTLTIAIMCVVLLAGLTAYSTTYREEDTNVFSSVSDAVSSFLSGKYTGAAITYDSATDTIRVIGNDTMCNVANPCTLSDINDASVAGGWGCVDNVHNYFTFNCPLQIGDGTHETQIVSIQEYAWLNKPWSVSNNGNLRIGESAEGGHFYGGTINTNVSVSDELRNDAALEVQPGGTLYLYNSWYKVFHPDARNNLYCYEGSKLYIDRVTIQRAEGSGSVTLYAPSDAVVSDTLFVAGGEYRCTVSGRCPEVVG